MGSFAAQFLRPEWSKPDGVHAVMTTRLGGVSRPPWDSFNLGVNCGDASEDVVENRRQLRLQAALPAEPWWLQQVHGTSIAAAAGVPPAAPPEADGAWTDRPGVVLAVMAADCLPVLLVRNDGCVVAAIHAGWRGLAAGVIDRCLDVLPGALARYSAWLGPRIGPSHFIVGDDVRAAFERDDDALAFARRGDARWHADLGALAAHRLRARHVAVQDSRLCTASDRRLYYSHRRDGRCGRMAAIIWIT